MNEISKDSLKELVKDSCRECPRIRVAAGNIALKAIEARIGFDVAAETFTSILDPDCAGPEPPTCSTIGCQHKAGDRYLSDAAHELSFE